MVSLPQLLINCCCYNFIFFWACSGLQVAGYMVIWGFDPFCFPPCVLAPLLLWPSGDASCAGSIITCETDRFDMCLAYLLSPSLYAVRDEYLGLFLQYHVCGQYFYPLPPGLEAAMQLVILCPVQARSHCWDILCYIQASASEKKLCTCSLVT